MLVLAIMCIGILIGTRFIPKQLKKIIEKLQVICTLLLIFSMGVTLGQRENFLLELRTLGWTSFLYFLFPVLCSVLIVYLLTKAFMSNHSKKGDK